MSKKRRSSRNIWNAPPAERKPFDYESGLDASEPAQEESIPEEPSVDEFRAEADEEVPAAPFDIEEPVQPRARSKHLRKRPVVLPRLSSKPGKHSLGPAPEPELEPDAELAPEPEWEPEPVVEPVVEVEPEPVAEADPDEVLPEDELFPKTVRSKRPKHLRKRPVVLPKRTGPGRHSLRGDEPVDLPVEFPDPGIEPIDAIEEEEVPDVIEPAAHQMPEETTSDEDAEVLHEEVSLYEPRSVEDLERELDEERAIEPEEREYRPRHVRRKKVLFPGRPKAGKHSLGAAPPAEPESSDLASDDGDLLEPEAPVEEVQPDEPEDLPVEIQAGSSEESSALEAPARDRRRRRKGRHRRPEAGLLPKERSATGRHAIRRPEVVPEPDVQPPTEDGFEDPYESGSEEVVEELPSAELAEVDMGSDDEEVFLLEEPEPEPEPEQEPEPVPVPVAELAEVDLGWDDEDVTVVEDQAEDELVDEEAVAFDDDLDYSDEDDFDVLDEEVAADVPERLLPRRKRRRRSKGVRVLVGLITAVVTAAATVGAGLALDTQTPSGERPERRERGGAVAPVGGESTATLVYAVREADEDRGPVWLTLLTYDPVRDKAGAIYIPAHLASEIPGRGLLSLSDGWVSGGPSLLLASAENLLGMKIDRYVELSDNDAEIMFDATGPLTIDVPSEVQVPIGTSQAQVLFDQGIQELDTDFLVRLLYTRGLDVDDAELGSRILAFWDSLLTRYAGDRTGLSEVIASTGPALESDASTDDLAEFFESLASVPEEDVLLASLPVRPIASGDDELYSTDVEEASRLLTEALGDVGTSEDDARVQVLNGNGVPGIGAEVADRLIGEGFRVILSGNARRFDYETTVIVTYDDSEEGRALAERARLLLGVGEVQISAQAQGSVDLTIIVGKDFLRAP